MGALHSAFSRFGLGSVAQMAFANSVGSVANQDLTVKQTLVLPAESYALSTPESVQHVVHEVAHDSFIDTNPVSITEVPEARVFFNGQQCLLRSADEQVLLRYNVEDSERELVKSKRHRRLKGTSLLLGSSPGANCYYHWMFDILPKLGILQKSGFDLNKIDHFLTRSTNHAFQIETLAQLGIHKDRIVHTRKKQHWVCDQLINVNIDNGINMKMHRFIPLWLKHVFPSLSSNESQIKLYITRPEGARRGIANEHALLPILKEFGYTVMPMEGLSVAEQSRLLSRVSVLVSPHGGGLSNMIFCRPGTQIVELFGHHVFPYYYGLSHLCGHQYHLLMKDQLLYPQAVQFQSALQAGSHESQMTTVSKDFTVDSEAFRATLARLDAGYAKHQQQKRLSEGD